MNNLFLYLYFTEKKLFTSTTYKHFNVTKNHVVNSEINGTLSSTQSTISKVITYFYRSVQVFLELIISYLSFISMLSEVYKSVMGKII